MLHSDGDQITVSWDIKIIDVRPSSKILILEKTRLSNSITLVVTGLQMRLLFGLDTRFRLTHTP